MPGTNEAFPRAIKTFLCVETLCREINSGRRKMLVEMATGTGKTRTAAALIKRLFEANAITRVLFLVDRIPFAKQTEDVTSRPLVELNGLDAVERRRRRQKSSG